MSVMSSRSSSASSTSSRTSSIGRMPSHLSYTPFDLETRATQILTSLANDQCTKSVLPHISPMIQVEHNDNAPAYSLDSYLLRFASAGPNVRLDVKEACVDELQRKVWVRSEISGFPNGVVKESFDMLFFDQDGVLVRGIDYQKIKRRW